MAKLLKAKVAADKLGITERTLYSYTEPRGPIPAVRLGRMVRYSDEALDRFINGDNQEEATSDNQEVAACQ